MSDPLHGPYHRTGEPGGPGCPVASLRVTVKLPDGKSRNDVLLDAGKLATELQLLRTIAEGLGVKWGYDDLGWWAAIPGEAQD